MAIYSKITGLGFYVPERIVTNDEMAQWMNTTDEWIVERTGIKERHFAKAGYDTVSSMGARAAKIALERAGKTPQDIDLLVFATLSPDYYFPGGGVAVQRELGLRQIPCFDIREQCSGFIYAISLADQYIKTGFAKTVLIIGSEIQSDLMEISDRGRSMSVIFGDGAGAALIEAHNEAGKGILSTHLHADGTHAEELMLKHTTNRAKDVVPAEVFKNTEEFLPRMNGKLVFMNAVRYFPEVIREALTKNNLQIHDIDLFVPHQANVRITQAVQKELQLPDEKVVSNIHKYGNTTAASIPIAFTEAWEAGRVKEGDLICLASFGSGFTWASTLIRW